jgi:hypothetical protein
MREDITLALALPAANELLGAYRTHFCTHPAPVHQERRTSPISGSVLLNNPICPLMTKEIGLSFVKSHVLKGP